MSCNSLSVANSDIDGIGIRASMYAQAFLALLPIGIALFAGDYDVDNFQKHLADDIKLNATAVLATGCALLVASFIQAGRGSLDLYDALIVLQLSWLNNLTSAFPTLLRAVMDDSDGAVKEQSFWRKVFLYMLHCTATGAFGIWVFHDINAWTPGCASEYYLMVCGQPLQANGPAVRIAVLVVSAIAVAPVINVLAMFGVIVLICNIEGFLCRCNAGHTPVLALLAWATPSVLIILGTEQFITKNSDVIVGASDQSAWTFGQILALLLVFLPLWTALDRTITLWRSPAQPLNPQIGVPRDEEEGAENIPLNQYKPPSPMRGPPSYRSS